MSNNNEIGKIHEYSTFPKKAVIVSLLIVALLLVFYLFSGQLKDYFETVLTFLNSDQNAGSENINQSENIDQVAYEYEFIQNPSEITVTEPKDLVENFLEEDLKEYNLIVENTPSVYINYPEYDDIFNVRYGDYNYIDLLNSDVYPRTAELFALYERDLMVLTSYYQDKFALYRDRESVGIVPLLSTAIPSYPHARAVGAIGVESFFQLIDPENASDYQYASSEYLTRGVAYGLYLPSELTVANSLVDQYVEIALKDSRFQQMLLLAQSEFKSD